MRTIVLGAGISGVMTSYFLSKDGHDVTVIERHSEPAMETSHSNGGVVGGTQVEPWAQSGLPWKILGWIGNDDAPILLHTSEISRMWRWGCRFLRNCTAGRYRRNMETSLRLTLYSLELFSQVRADLGMTGPEYDLNTTGALKVYLTRETLDEGVRGCEVLAEMGMPFRALDAEECVDQEPALRPALETLAGGICFPREEIGDCRKFTKTIAAQCQASGVTFRYGVTAQALDVRGGRVERVRTDQGSLTADAYVVALASHTPQLLRGIGIRVPICPIKGVTVTVPVAGWEEPVRGAVMDHSRLFGLIRIGDRLRLSGSAEVTGYDTVPDPRRCDAIIRNVLELFPDFAGCLKASPSLTWAGVRGNSPDGPPILGPTPLPNLYLNAGHGPQGWSTSCGAAKLVADTVRGRQTDIDLDGLTLERF